MTDFKWSDLHAAMHRWGDIQAFIKTQQSFAMDSSESKTSVVEVNKLRCEHRDT